LARTSEGRQLQGVSQPTLKLRPNALGRVLHGHPWVYRNELEALLPDGHDGMVVECRDRSGRFLGTGIYNSRSQIAWRRLSRDRVELNEAWLRGALERAIGRRATESALRTPHAAIRRLVWAESDELPGVVIDQFGGTLVMQIHSLAMDMKAELLGKLLGDLLHPEEIIFRNDSPIRRLEGLPAEVRTLSGRTWEPRWIEIDGCEYWLDLMHGQKTGFYLDQRPQHASVAHHIRKLAAQGRSPRVLDAFCNQGPFALHAARAGASRVLGVDSAEDAVASARRNAERNRVQADFETANVFDWLNAKERESEPAWDVIVLDPPPFARSRGGLADAMRGYKEINLRAMKRLAPGGLLATYSCSHHVQDADLRGVVGQAAGDAKRRVEIVEWAHQPADHPVLVTMPESEYLRGYILKVE